MGCAKKDSRSVETDLLMTERRLNLKGRTLYLKDGGLKPKETFVRSASPSMIKGSKLHSAHSARLFRAVSPCLLSLPLLAQKANFKVGRTEGRQPSWPPSLLLLSYPLLQIHLLVPSSWAHSILFPFVLAARVQAILMKLFKPN